MVLRGPARRRAVEDNDQTVQLIIEPRSSGGLLPALAAAAIIIGAGIGGALLMWPPDAAPSNAERESARIDEHAKIWYAACQIPLRSVTVKKIGPGTRWRANLYRIEGEGPDSERRFMCWQPTCVKDRDPNHVPENFGTLIFAK